MKKLSLTTLICLTHLTGIFAQSTNQGNFVFQHDKYPVVVAVLLIILLGIFGFLIILERKIKRIEKKSDI